MEVVQRVLVQGAEQIVLEPEPRGQRAGEAFGVGGGVIALTGQGEGGGVAHDRLIVVAPVTDQRPARRRLAGIPLALCERRYAARRPGLAQPTEQLHRAFELVLAEGGVVPFRALAIVDRDEGRLAAHRQAHVLGGESLVHRRAEREDLLPDGLGVGQGDARALVDAGDAVVEVEVGGRLTGHAADRRGAGRLWRAGERNVPFAGEQPRRRVEPDPAGAGQVDLGPGVQVGEVFRRARGAAVERLDVGGQLHEVARDEAGGETEVAQDLHQQPAAVAAGAVGDRQRLLARLHARLHAHAVGHALLHGAVDLDQRVDDRRTARRAIGREPGGELLAGGLRLEVGGELAAVQRVVVEREALGTLLDEEVEGVDDGELGDQVDGHGELPRLLGEDEAGEVVAERVLLPVDEVPGGLDLEAVALDRRAAVRGGTQAHHVRAEGDRLRVAIDGGVIERNADAHARGSVDVESPAPGEGLSSLVECSSSPPSSAAESGGGK